jgi:hypothetical protein
VIAALRRLPRLELAIVAVAIGVLTFLGVERERAAQRVLAGLDSYSTHDSTSGGYRAWFELMQREGARVERFESRPVFLDRSIQTLIWADPLPFDPRQQLPSESDVRALEGWVRDGGRLVYLGHDDNAASQGILKFPRSTKSGTNEKPFVAPQFVAAGVRQYPAISVLRWRQGKRATLLADAQGILVVTYPYGKGQVVAAIDEPSFSNANIGRPDFARLAYALALPKRGATVAFNESVHGFVTPEHWWAVVPRPFAIAIWCAFAILLSAFAAAALRLGPPVVPQPGDPNSAAFLDALAALLERGRARRKALLDAANSAQRAAARALGLPDDTALDKIAAAIEEPEQRRLFVELEQTRGIAKPNEAILVRGVALAQRLRKEWTTHGRPRY